MISRPCRVYPKRHQGRSLMKYAFTFLSLLVASGSVHGQEIYRGHYVSAFERKIFVPCGVDEMWWFNGAGKSFYSELEEFIKKNSLRSRKSDMKPNTPFYIEVRGEKSAKGKWGHRGLYQYELNVTELIDLSVTDKCSTKPN